MMSFSKKNLRKRKLSNAEIEKTNEAERQVDMNLQLIEESLQSLEEKDEVLEVKETNARESLSVAQELIKHGTDCLVGAHGESAAISITSIMIKSSQQYTKNVEKFSTKLGKERQNI